MGDSCEDPKLELVPGLQGLGFSRGAVQWEGKDNMVPSGTVHES